MIHAQLPNSFEVPEPHRTTNRPDRNKTTEKKWGTFADNVAVIAHALCNCPITEVEKAFDYTDNEWAQFLAAIGNPSRELRVTIRELLFRLRFSPNTAALALLYLYRYLDNVGNCPSDGDLTFITGAFIVSNKFHDEYRISLKRWSNLSHIPIPEIVEVELKILESLNWDAYISPTSFYWWGRVMHKFLQANR